MLKEPKNKSTDEDEILRYYTGEVESLPTELDKRRRIYEYILNHLLDHRPEQFIVKLLDKMYGIKQRTAYNYIQSTKYIHGSFYIVDKGFELYKQLQTAERALRKAEDANDVDKILKALDAKTKIIALIPDKKDDIDYEKMGNRNYYIVLNTGGKQVILDNKSLVRMDPAQRQNLLDQVSAAEIDATYEILKTDGQQ
jgi:hypothetical protein